MNNIITATFGSLRKTRTRPAWIADHGMILRFAGIELPAAYEVHFSNSRSIAAKVSIGDESGVEIPDEYFHNADQIFAWLYLHTGEDDGYTVYEAEIPLIKRSEVTDEQPTPQQESAIEQAIIALNIAVEQCETNVSHYPMIVNDYWVVWDAQIGQFVNTGVQAKGENGRNGADGRDGRDGTNGAPGEDGEDGFSPIVTVEEITGGHRVTITDAQGDHVFDVMDGSGGSGGSSDYNDLSNKPQIAGTTLSGNKSLADLGIAAASDIPTVPVQSVNSKMGTVVLNATDVGALPDSTPIPTKTSQLTNDSGFITSAPVTSVNAKTGAVVLSAADVGAGTYSKPSGGIPKTDLASAVQTSLGKADSALQSFTEEDPTVPSWAKQQSKPSYTKSEVGLGNVANVLQYSASNPPPAQVFMAEYGVTNSSDIDARYLGGIFVRCRTVGGIDHAMVYCDGNGYALFSCYDPDSGIISVLECANDVWDEWTVTIPTTASDVGAEPAITEVTVSTAGAVTQALDAGKIYHFTGALTSLTITLNAAGAGRLAYYHFDFDCGAAAPTVTIPNTVTMPDSQTFDASTHYEVDILNNYGVVQSWSAS